jgi:hypothetical protein
MLQWRTCNWKETVPIQERKKLNKTVGQESSSLIHSDQGFEMDNREQSSGGYSEQDMEDMGKI